MAACFQRFYLFFVALLFCASQLYSQTFTGISPNNGPPGTPVTITGTGLSNITTIEFGLIQVTATPNGSGTSVTATLPSPVVPFETPGVVAITAIDSIQGPLVTGLQFAIKGDWTVVVTNSLGGAKGIGNAATIPVEQPLPGSATPTTDSIPPTFSNCLGVAIHPSGRTAYVVNMGGSVSAIDLATNTVKGKVAVGNAPAYIAINTLGTKAYVTNFGDGTISVLDISGAKEQAPVVGSSVPSDSGGPSPASGPLGIAISFDNSTLYVINTTSQHLVAFSLSNPDMPVISAVVTTPSGSFTFIAVTPDNTKAYIADVNSSNVYSYFLQNGQINPKATIPTSQPSPLGMVITRDGKTLYAACNSPTNAAQISVIDTEIDTIVSNISINATTNLLDIVITPDDKFLYVVDQDQSLNLNLVWGDRYCKSGYSGSRSIWGHRSTSPRHHTRSSALGCLHGFANSYTSDYQF